MIGDIGCYTLGALPPLSAMDTCLCMGAIASAWPTACENVPGARSSRAAHGGASSATRTFIHSRHHRR